MATYGLDVPAFAAHQPQDFYRRVVAIAERHGFHNLWVGDHLLWHQPRFETFALLGLLSGLTRLTIGTGIVLAPLRPAWWTAKSAATLARTSPGGFILGLGAGGEFAPEFALAQVDPAQRGTLVEQTVSLCREAWGGGIEGFSPVSSSPVPIWLAGRKERALRRIARIADGWLGLFLDPTEFRAAADGLRLHCAEQGRPMVSLGMTLWVCIDDDECGARQSALARIADEYQLPEKAFARHVIAGPAEHVASVVQRYIDAGAEHICFHIAHPDPLTQAERIGVEVLPLLGMPAVGEMPSISEFRR